MEVYVCDDHDGHWPVGVCSVVVAHSWKLPRDSFNPDCGISFDKQPFNTHTAHPMKYEPSGTNLFDAAQAEAMVRHMIDGLPQ